MQITIDLPEEIGQQLTKKWENLPQKVLESLAIEGYREGVLTSAQVQDILKLESRWITERFLSQSHAYLDYTEREYQEDIDTLYSTIPFLQIPNNK